MKKRKENQGPAGISRREFITTTGLVLAGSAIKFDTSAIGKIQDIAEEPIIDIHQHTDYNGRDNKFLAAHQRDMGATTTILLPSGRPLKTASTHEGISNGLQAKCTGNEVCYQFAKKHPKEFLFGANEVPDYPGAIKEIEKYLKKGAVVIGEQKFGIECDSPEMQKIYQLAQEYNVPVLMHWQFKMYNYGIERFHTMLEKYPKVNFIGHAQSWWSFIDKNYIDSEEMYPNGKVTPGGLTDRLLADYPNMFGDLSAGSGYNSLTRDEDQAREFLIRHQDKLLFGSDCPDPAFFGGPSKDAVCQGIRTIAEIRKLASTKAIERKILYENAKKLFRL
ncbi:MAG: amidohydrolase [Chitinophagales bacterium]|nr:amidohydrolase [Chitinophagales bacterium]